MTTISATTTDAPAATDARPAFADISLIAAIYEAFGRGDVEAILARLRPDVSWDADWQDNFVQHEPIAYLLPRRGPAEVAEFFAAVGAATVHEFAVLDLMASERQVVAQVRIDLELPNGGRLRDEELHLWTIAPDGRVSALRHYIDTAKHLAAARGEDTTRPAAATVTNG